MRSFDRDNFYKCPSPQLRVNDELKHNPYVGSFHGISRLSEEAQHKAMSIHNPHLGRIRHSPAVCAYPIKMKLNLGFKGLLYDDGPFSQPQPVLSQVQAAVGRNAKLHLTPSILRTLPTFLFSLPGARSRSGSEASAGSGAIGIADEDSDSLAEHGEVEDGDEDWSPSCAICLDAFSDGCELRTLACGHCFHSRCVDTWLCGQHSDESVCTATCPTCRRDAVADFANGVSSPSTFSAIASPIIIPTGRGRSLTENSQPNTLGGDSERDEILQRTRVDSLSNSEVESEIDEVIYGLMGGRGLTENSLLAEEDIQTGERACRSNREGLENGPDMGPVAADEIPEHAFMNVGRFLYAGLSLNQPSNEDSVAGVGTASDGSNSAEATDEATIEEMYAVIPEVEDDSMLGSTYDLCGVLPR